MEKYQKTTLKNGLRIITIPMPEVKSLTVMILIGAGSRYEDEKISGLSHFLEHMAFKGTKKRPSALAISTEIDSIGGQFNAFTSKDHTGYYIKAASKHLPLSLDMLSDMILNSKFDESEIEKEKKVIIEEINLYEDTPIKKISDVFEQVLYKGTSLGQLVIGNRQVIKKVKRKDFLDYIQGLYSPDNAVVVVAGGYKDVGTSGHQDIRRLIEKAFGNWKKHPTWQLEQTSDKQEKPKVKIEYKKTEQAHLCLGVRALPLGSPDRYVLSVLTIILGVGMSSRLFTEVRETRGLAYYIRSHATRYIDAGNFVTQAGVDLKRIDEAIRIILAEYAKIKMKKEKIKREELKKAKEYLKGHLILELEDSKAVALLFGIQEVLEKRIRTPAQIIKEIDKVRTEDVYRVAKNIFRREKLNLAIIGPFKNRQRFEKLLEL